jgi:hypothetical protein
VGRSSAQTVDKVIPRRSAMVQVAFGMFKTLQESTHPPDTVADLVRHVSLPILVRLSISGLQQLTMV